MLGAFNYISELYQQHRASAKMAKALQHDLAQLKGAGSVEEPKGKLADVDGKLSETEGPVSRLRKEDVGDKDALLEVTRAKHEEMVKLEKEMRKEYSEARDEGFEHCLTQALPHFDDQTNWVVNEPALVEYIKYFRQVNELKAGGGAADKEEDEEEPSSSTFLARDDHDFVGPFEDKTEQGEDVAPEDSTPPA